MTTEIKICGLTNLDDALACLEHNVDYLGFVLYPKSPRYLSPSDLVTIRNQLPDDAKCIGVFVNCSREDVQAVASDCALYGVQIHGDEIAGDFVDLPLPVWRAVLIDNDKVQPEPELWHADRYVIDAAPRGPYGQYGGAGIKADWTLARDAASRYPTMLAGGLTPDNVSDAIRQVNPIGVDVASGVEDRPGKKDHHKIVEFVKNARRAAER
jgi:phosphoribosylanthranilate isomerase